MLVQYRPLAAASGGFGAHCRSPRSNFPTSYKLVYVASPVFVVWEECSEAAGEVLVRNAQRDLAPLSGLGQR